MLRNASIRRTGVVAGVLVAAMTGCSSQHGASGLLPGSASNAGAFAPLAVATPPVTAPVTIPYPYRSESVTTTYSGPHAKPVSTKSTDDGLTKVIFRRDAKTGIYDVIETIASKAGYNETLDSAVSFPGNYKGGTAQIILSDNYTYVAGKLTETGMDTYPSGQDSVNFPLTNGRRWSAAAAHASYYNVQQTGKGAFGENVTTNEAADGTYIGQQSFSALQGFANQSNSASTFDVSLTQPSTFTYAAPAAGFNLMLQTFALPSNGKIAVHTSGKKPIPYKAGTVLVPDWYPGGGPLPKTLYADNWRVSGAVSTPAGCGKWSGKPSTEVVESSYTIDPIQGFDNSYTAKYYMASLNKNQFWFACIVEDFTDTTYANGWFVNGAHWGGTTSQTVGTEVLIATGASPKADALAALPAMHAFGFVPPARLHQRVSALGLGSATR